MDGFWGFFLVLAIAFPFVCWCAFSAMNLSHDGDEEYPAGWFRWPCYISAAFVGASFPIGIASMLHLDNPNAYLYILDALPMLSVPAAVYGANALRKRNRKLSETTKYLEQELTKTRSALWNLQHPETE